MSNSKQADKKWLQARKKEWKSVSKALRSSRIVDRDQIAYIKDYFFTGVEPESGDWLFATRLKLFEKLWFHPDQSEENWKQLIDQADGRDFVESIKMFSSFDSIYFDEMNGLQLRMLRVFCDIDGDAPMVIFKGEQKKLYNRKIFFWQWYRSMSKWLTGWCSNPSYHLQFMTHLAFKCYQYYDYDDDPLIDSDGRHDYLMNQFLSQCAHFVEPVGMPGEETPQKLWVESFHDFLSNQALPPVLDQLWKRLSTREERSSYWVDCIRPEYEYHYKPRKNRTETYVNLEDQGFLTLAVHGDRLHPDFIKTAVLVYKELGFTESDFASHEVKVVELGEHLTPEIKERLGYNHEDAIPGYLYRIITTSDYVDSDDAIIPVDCIMPVPKSTSNMPEDTPIFFLLPRPEKAYNPNSAVAYRLNIRLMRRVFKHKTGHDLLIYFDYRGRVDRYDKMNPFYNVKYHPFINARRAFPIRPEIDFPEWAGAPLPPLF